MSGPGGAAGRAAPKVPRDHDDEHVVAAQHLKAEVRYLEASARLADLEATRVAAEIAQQPLRARKLEAEIRREEAEAAAVTSARFRAEAMLVVFLLLAILVLALALVNPTYLQAVGGGGALGGLAVAAGRHMRSNR